MIKNTFSILSGIGEGLERKLWKRGIIDWESFLGTKAINFISPQRKSFFDGSLLEAKAKLDRSDSGFFARTVKQKEHWRLYERFREDAVCLDIETNGYPHWSGGYVTVVGLYDGYDYKALVKGENLTAASLRKELSRYKYLITFFGAGFDVPFLRESLGVQFEGAHFDLCFGTRKLGLSGGLKKLEEKFGIQRDESVRGFDGYDAVRLWREARRGSGEARDLLVAYNRCDTVNLHAFAGRVYPMLKAQTGIEEYLN